MFIGADTIYLCSVQHVAGLFAIVWYVVFVYGGTTLIRKISDLLKMMQILLLFYL